MSAQNRCGPTPVIRDPPGGVIVEVCLDVDLTESLLQWEPQARCWATGSTVFSFAFCQLNPHSWKPQAFCTADIHPVLFPFEYPQDVIRSPSTSGHPRHARPAAYCAGSFQRPFSNLALVTCLGSSKAVEGPGSCVLTAACLALCPTLP